jgi:N-formylglutamate amidohydrolase
LTSCFCFYYLVVKSNIDYRGTVICEGRIVNLDDFASWMKDTSPDMVIYETGILPLILTVPHGGSSSINSLPKRIPTSTTIDFAADTDVDTIKVALSIATHIKELTGNQPYVVMNLLDRKYLDVNRAPADAYQHPLAQGVYKRYHRQIRTAIRSVKSQFGNGLLVDIHGQSAEPADLYFGDRDGLTIQSLTTKYGTDILNNIKGLVTQLVLKEYEVYPRLGKPTPASVFGGYTVRTYGSHNADGIDAEQIEIHYRIRSDASKREQFTRDFSECLIAFIDEYYSVRIER